MTTDAVVEQLKAGTRIDQIGGFVGKPGQFAFSRVRRRGQVVAIEPGKIYWWWAGPCVWLPAGVIVSLPYFDSRWETYLMAAFAPVIGIVSTLFLVFYNHQSAKQPTLTIDYGTREVRLDEHDEFAFDEIVAIILAVEQMTLKLTTGNRSLASEFSIVRQLDGQLLRQRLQVQGNHLSVRRALKQLAQEVGVPFRRVPVDYPA